MAQPDSSILINARSSTLSGYTSNAFFVQTIINVTTVGNKTNLMWDDNANKEFVHSTNFYFVNPVSFRAGTVTHCCVNFLTLNSGL